MIHLPIFLWPLPSPFSTLPSSIAPLLHRSPPPSPLYHLCPPSSLLSVSHHYLLSPSILIPPSFSPPSPLPSFSPLLFSPPSLSPHWQVLVLWSHCAIRLPFFLPSPISFSTSTLRVNTHLPLCVTRLTNTNIFQMIRFKTPLLQ